MSSGNIVNSPPRWGSPPWSRSTTAEELERALSSGAEIIGINNRDLKTFATDIGTSLALAPLVPADRIVVSESGIRSRAEIETLMQAGVRAFLIGETLVAAPDIGAKLREFLGDR